MKKLTKSAPFLLALVMIILSGCASPQHLVESGNYDQAIETAVRRLAGKKNKKEKLVQALEEGFAKVTEKDMRLAESLKAENRPENWARINEIYRRIKARQERIEPLLPLIDQEGVKANFRFVRVEGLERESREKAAAYFYDSGSNLLTQARNGDKMAARRAYNEFDKIGKYYSNYRDRDQLMKTAQELGLSYILFSMENQARVILPRAFEEEILRMGVRDLNDRWKEYHLQPQNGIRYDYKVVMKLTDIAVSPESVKERAYEDTREIEDGFDYILDERGNVTKDSLGNDIKIPRNIIVRARVLETYQSKAARVAGRLEFIDLRNNQLIDSQPLATEAIFENYASTFYGDKRALSAESKRKIGNTPQPFPTSEELLFTAAEELKPVVKEKISRTRKLI